MSFPHLIFTDEGKSLQLKAMQGDSIIFTKVEIGNGEEPENISELTQLNNKLYVCGITDFKINNGYATVHWSLDSMAVASEFNWTEYGIYAKDSFNNEILYAYAYDSAPQTIPSANSSSITQIEADINIAIGDAENVNAIIGEYSAYASKEVVSEHVNNQSNPHKVTKVQIGLENVDNVSTDDATPTFKEAEKLENISSGETVSTLWGKVKKAISSLKAHIENKNNPHGITATKIGAASSSHTHNTSDINSGVLSAARGGTGFNSILSFLMNYGLNDFRIKTGHSSNITNDYISIPLENGLNIVIGKDLVTAEANSISTVGHYWDYNYFSQPPFVFATIVTEAIDRHVSVSSVTRKGFNIVFQNNHGSASTNPIFYLAIG